MSADGGRISRRRPSPPLALVWRCDSNSENLLRISSETSYHALFQLDPNAPLQDAAGREAAVRHRRRLLLLAAHPDRGPPEERAERHAATVNVNRLFREAALSWSQQQDMQANGVLPSITTNEGKPAARSSWKPAAHSPLFRENERETQIVGARVRIVGTARAGLDGMYGTVIDLRGETVSVQVDGESPKAPRSLPARNVRQVPRSFVRGGTLELLDKLSRSEDEVSSHTQSPSGEG
ncbi:MAG: hypothetical protein SGPRY_005154 [Prymnesium sp.]